MNTTLITYNPPYRITWALACEAEKDAFDWDKASLYVPALPDHKPEDGSKGYDLQLIQTEGSTADDLVKRMLYNVIHIATEMTSAPDQRHAEYKRLCAEYDL